MESNPFEEYYKETFGPEAELPKASDSKRDVKADADKIKGPINDFISDVNALIGKVFEAEKVKGTRTDLIITLVIGGLAFTVANVFNLITKNFKVDMSEDIYINTFLGMYKTALKDIKDSEGSI